MAQDDRVWLILSSISAAALLAVVAGLVATSVRSSSIRSPADFGSIEVMEQGFSKI